jgi:hypothetical protein
MLSQLARLHINTPAHRCVQEQKLKLKEWLEPAQVVNYFNLGNMFALMLATKVCPVCLI